MLEKVRHKNTKNKQNRGSRFPFLPYVEVFGGEVDVPTEGYPYS